LKLRAAFIIAILIALLLAGILPGLADESSPPHDATRRRVRVPILMYHYVSVPPPDADKYRLDLSVTPPQFAAHIAWLAKNGYTAITLDDLVLALDKAPAAAALRDPDLRRRLRRRLY
jgi:hypothetical protein